VLKDANPSEIKKSYRKLVKEYHPDVNPDNKEAEEKFKEISSAYEVLSDTDKKLKYDQFGDSDGNQSRGFGGFGNGFGGFDFQEQNHHKELV
jgi:molecular chaperone DnaJ